ncbi:hypothetical protein [Nonomuraea sp. NPDC003709]|uniref:hypothetical protein n=1 Tax=Nonomuraea sp. NPDC003709 TaxID=3154450 RepID=UPI0033A81B1D
MELWLSVRMLADGAVALARLRRRRALPGRPYVAVHRYEPGQLAAPEFLAS